MISVAWSSVQSSRRPSVDRAICDAFAHVTCVAGLRQHLVFETDEQGHGIHLNGAAHPRIADPINVSEPVIATLRCPGLI